MNKELLDAIENLLYIEADNDDELDLGLSKEELDNEKRTFIVSHITRDKSDGIVSPRLDSKILKLMDDMTSASEFVYDPDDMSEGADLFFAECELAKEIEKLRKEYNRFNGKSFLNFILRFKKAKLQVQQDKDQQSK